MVDDKGPAEHGYDERTDPFTWSVDEAAKVFRARKRPCRALQRKLRNDFPAGSGIIFKNYFLCDMSHRLGVCYEIRGRSSLRGKNSHSSFLKEHDSVGDPNRISFMQRVLLSRKFSLKHPVDPEPESSSHAGAGSDGSKDGDEEERTKASGASAAVTPESSDETPYVPKKSRYSYKSVVGVLPGFKPWECTNDEWDTRIMNLKKLNACEHHNQLQKRLQEELKTARSKASGPAAEFLRLALQAHLTCCSLHPEPGHVDLIDTLTLLSQAQRANEAERRLSRGGADTGGATAKAGIDLTVPTAETLWQQVVEMKELLKEGNARAASPASPPEDLFQLLLVDPGVANTICVTKVCTTEAQLQALWDTVSDQRTNQGIRETIRDWIKENDLLKELLSTSGVVGETTLADVEATQCVSDSGICVHTTPSSTYHALTGNRDSDVSRFKRDIAALEDGAVSDFWEAKRDLAEQTRDLDVESQLQLGLLLDTVYAYTRMNAFNDESKCRRRHFQFRRKRMAQADLLRQARGLTSSFDNRKRFYGQKWHATRGYFGEHRRAKGRQVPASMVIFGNGKFAVKCNRMSYKASPTSSLAKAFSYNILVVMVDEVG